MNLIVGRVGGPTIGQVCACCNETGHRKRKQRERTSHESPTGFPSFSMASLRCKVGWFEGKYDFAGFNNYAIPSSGFEHSYFQNLLP